MGKFAIYSKESGYSTSAKDISPTPVNLAILDSDPIVTGSYEPYAGSVHRGSVIPTLGGVYIQDFGIDIQDQRISFSDEAAISADTVNRIHTMEIVAGASYYFTDGYDCYEVKFAIPNGFVYKRNLITSFYNRVRYDYEVNLVVVGAF